VGRYTAVVVSNSDAANQVKLAVVSHNHPAATITKPGEDYGLQSGSGGHIAVGPPKVADVANTKPVTAEPNKISAENLAKLKSDISKLRLRPPGRRVTSLASRCKLWPRTSGQARWISVSNTSEPFSHFDTTQMQNANEARCS
jgi:hypothetical protein